MMHTIAGGPEVCILVQNVQAACHRFYYRQLHQMIGTCCAEDDQTQKISASLEVDPGQECLERDSLMLERYDEQHQMPSAHTVVGSRTLTHLPVLQFQMERHFADRQH